LELSVKHRCGMVNQDVRSPILATFVRARSQQRTKHKKIL
jgi:hypothetical protein